MRRVRFIEAFVFGATAIAGTLAVRSLARALIATPLADASTAGGGMMGGGMQEMMSPSNRGPMRTGMELFRRHADVRRTVSEIPGGIRAVSESDNPDTAALLKTHVSEMYARLAANDPFPYPMSRSVPALFANSTAYHRTLTLLPKGIAVTETSNDARMVATIRAHAREIDRFVREGMPGMMRSMM